MTYKSQVQKPIDGSKFSDEAKVARIGKRLPVAFSVRSRGVPWAIDQHPPSVDALLRLQRIWLRSGQADIRQRGGVRSRLPPSLTANGAILR